jgi:dTDP-D-glucose 4,6-dehydratase
MFGTPNEYPQTETTVLRPRSPYAVGKAAAHWLVTNYREIHGLYAVSASCSIMSPRCERARLSPAGSVSGWRKSSAESATS